VGVVKLAVLARFLTVTTKKVVKFFEEKVHTQRKFSLRLWLKENFVSFFSVKLGTTVKVLIEAGS